MRWILVWRRHGTGETGYGEEYGCIMVAQYHADRLNREQTEKWYWAEPVK